MTMLAYHGKEELRAHVLAEVEQHERADAFAQGLGYWDAFQRKGCAVGCMIKNGHHQTYATKWGIPVELARLEDALFEEMSPQASKGWPRRFHSAARVGADLSGVWQRFLFVMLTDSERGLVVLTDSERAVEALAGLFRRLEEGESVEPLEWYKARERIWNCETWGSGDFQWALKAGVSAIDGMVKGFASEFASAHAAAIQNGPDEEKGPALYDLHAWMADTLIRLMTEAPIP